MVADHKQRMLTLAQPRTSRPCLTVNGRGRSRSMFLAHNDLRAGPKAAGAKRPARCPALVPEWPNIGPTSRETAPRPAQSPRSLIHDCRWHAMPFACPMITGLRRDSARRSNSRVGRTVDIRLRRGDTEHALNSVALAVAAQQTDGGRAILSSPGSATVRGKIRRIVGTVIIGSSRRITRRAELVKARSGWRSNPASQARDFEERHLEITSRR